MNETMTLNEALDVADASSPYTVPLGLQNSHRVDEALHVLAAEVRLLDLGRQAGCTDESHLTLMQERDEAQAEVALAFRTGYCWGTGEYRHPHVAEAWEDYMNQRALGEFR